MFPKVSIIILNWNGLNDTLECLESLKKISYPNYEVIVVDNGSKGNDADILKTKYDDYIKLIQNDNNYGFAEGNNIAIRFLLNHSNPDYFLLLNNDTIVDPQFLSELVKVAENNKNTGIVGPKTYLYQIPDRLQLAWYKVDMYRGKAIHVGSLAYDQGQYDKITSVDYMQGSSLLIKKSVLENVGLFDAKFFCYWEETDLCFRVKQAGYKIFYVPQAKIRHKKIANTQPWYKTILKKNKISDYEIYYMTRNNLWFMKKHATRNQFIIFTLYFFIIRFWFNIAMHLLYYHNFSGFKLFLHGIWDGLFNYH